MAYEGRDDDDALALPAVRLQRAHLATSVPLVVQPAPQPNGVGHWRMRVALQSRYAILGEAAGTPQTKWTDAGVATLTPSPTQAPALTPPTQHTVLAPLMRPSIDLALPLTSALAAANATVAADPSLPPPLMLMLNQQVFADGDVSDRIEIGLEAARHPDPDWTPTSPPPPTPPAPTSHPRYWPQIAPDPRLLGTGHDGSPVAMRLLGPVGWTLDTSVPASVLSPRILVVGFPAAASLGRGRRLADAEDPRPPLPGAGRRHRNRRCAAAAASAVHIALFAPDGSRRGFLPRAAGGHTRKPRRWRTWCSNQVP